MHPDTVRRLDRRLGVPICWLLTGLRRLSRRKPPTAPPRNILFVKLVEQGSTVLAARALERAARMVGRQNLYFLVFQRNRPILDIMDLLPRENILTVRDDSLRRFFLDVLRALWRLRRRRIDAAVDLEGFARASVILMFLAGARRRVGFHRFTSEAPYRGDLLTHRVAYNFHLHTNLAFLSLVAAGEGDPRDEPMLKERLPEAEYRPPPFVPQPEERRAMRERLRALAGREVSGPIVLLNPNASDLLPLRRWPAENFVALGRKLIEEYPEITVVITGAPDERDAAKAIARDIHPQRCLCLAGETTIRSLLVLYTISDVLVTNDSGPAHFAALTDIDIVALFGPETPVLYRPLSPRARCINAGLACSPCVSVLNHRFSPCKDNRCMQAITVEEVYGAVREALAGRRTRLRPERPIEARISL